jgi:CheY-like chemotaxis protein
MSAKKLETAWIMVIDHHPHMRRMVATMLRSLGARGITLCADAAEALRLLGPIEPDLIICDWHLTPTSGLEFARTVRRSGWSPDKAVPIILLTASNQRQQVAQARDAGVNSFLIKPVSTRSLARHVQRALSEPRRFVESAHDAGPCRRQQLRSGVPGLRRRITDDDASALREGEEAQVWAADQVAALATGLRVSLARAMPGDRQILRMVLAGARDAHARAEDAALRELADAAGSLARYLEATLATRYADPRVIEAHLAALISLSRQAGSAPERQAVVSHLDVMVSRKLKRSA